MPICDGRQKAASVDSWVRRQVAQEEEEEDEHETNS